MNDGMKFLYRPEVNLQIKEIPVYPMSKREKLRMFWNNLKFKYLVWKYRRSQKRK